MIINNGMAKIGKKIGVNGKLERKNVTANFQLPINQSGVRDNSLDSGSWFNYSARDSYLGNRVTKLIKSGEPL